SEYTGYLAWRAVVGAEASARWMPPADRVTTFLHRNFHLVAYPLRGQSAINLVAISKNPVSSQGWANSRDTAELKSAMAGAVPELLALVESATPWTTWPLHQISPSGAWVDQGIALIGDAAHATTPF